MAALRWIVLVLSLGVTGYGLFAYFALEPGSTVHPAMRAAYAEHPARILLHVAGAAVALAFGPLQFFPALRRRVRLHRALGFAYFAGVLTGGAAGLATAAIAYGGLVARVGFAALAVAWLVSGAAALAAARRRDWTAHEAWALRSFALTFAAVTLRLQMSGFAAAGVRFDDYYPVVAWLCWVPNLLVVEWVLLRGVPVHRGAPPDPAAARDAD
jgi:hypothetical protein